MTLPKIEEPTLYPPIIQYLKSLGFKAGGNVMVREKEPDILFTYKDLFFVIEVKIGKPDTIGLKAISQASDYARKLNTQNIIILIYPDSIKKEAISDFSIIDRIALNSNISILLFTELWTENLSNKDVTSTFNELKRIIDENKTKTDFASVVKLIKQYVNDLNSVVYQIRTDELISEVVNKLDLFTAIGEFEDKETAKKQITNLASFLLFNQILFYHIFKKKSQDNNLPELSEIKKLKEIKTYFNKITDIDYKSIYDVNILDYIPDSPEIISVLNDLIKAIKLLRAENITHDLAGRFFHDLIPQEVRKVLAAFYTHPNAADLLAGLAIDRWDETVIDPACGSGTLLVSSYNRKKKLYEEYNEKVNLSLMHKKFVENDLTGIDIMPFASHISALNLTMQNIEEKTNVVRIATQDSLDLIKILKNKQFKDGKFSIQPFSTAFQLTLDGSEKRIIKKGGAISSEGKGSEFILKPVDLVIMNPPFTDKDKMPEEMRKKLNINPLSAICGNDINLWGYFLALSHFLLKPGGKIAAVIPINIARGRATQKLRNFILDNYQIDYVVKPGSDIAFSENASFRDILFVATKSKPNKKNKTKILFLKKSIRNLKPDDVEQILKFDKNLVDLKEVSYDKLIENRKNLMPLLLSNNLDIIFEMLKKSSLIKKFDTSEIDIGLPFRPEGVADATFITNSSDKSRIKNAKVLLNSVEENEIKVYLKGLKPEQFSFTFNDIDLKAALRTTTGIKSISVNPESIDFIIVSKNDKYLDLLKSYGISVPEPFPYTEHFSKNIIKNGTFLVIPRKIRMDSPNTRVISVFYEKKLYGIGPSLWYFKNLNETDSKILSLYFNSIFTIIQIIMLKSESLGGAWFELMKSDWEFFKVLDTQKISDENKQILIGLFKKLEEVEFPSIIDQLEKRFWARIELDMTISKILGFQEKNLEKILLDTYDLILKELK